MAIRVRLLGAAIGCLATAGLLPAQLPTGDSTVTALKIVCDRDSVPVYVDGVLIGRTPLTQTLQVAPGWHRVAYFPTRAPRPLGNSRQSAYINTVMNLGEQTVLAEPGQTMTVVLSYRGIASEAAQVQRRQDSSRWISLAFVVTLLVIFGWGFG